MNRSLEFPKQIFLDTHAGCNLKCIQCDIHYLKNPADELTHEDRLGVIRQIATWNPAIRLLFSGGEPFLRKKELYDLAAMAKAQGVYCAVNTNGTLLKIEDTDKLPFSGINAVVFSVDHHLPEVHDRIRGVKGTFERVTKAVQQLTKSVRQPGSRCSVMLSAILGAHNLDTAEQLVDLSDELMCDGILFQPIQANFEGKSDASWWKTSEFWPREKEQVHNGINSLIRLKKEKRKMFQSVDQLVRIQNYFLNETRIQGGDCVSMHHHLMIDMRGEVRICFNMEDLKLPPLGNVKETPLKEIWHRSRGLANELSNCSRACGAMLCHSR